jgi:hypothetical protein
MLQLASELVVEFGAAFAAYRGGPLRASAMVELADFNPGADRDPDDRTTLPLIELLQKQDDGDLPLARSPKLCCSC